MTQPAPRPKRPVVLIVALVLLPLAALLFGMTETNLSPGSGGNSSFYSVVFLMSILAIWFNGARVTAVVLLALQTAQWFPGAVANIGNPEVSQAAAYAVIGTVLFGVGTVLVFQIPSNAYYRQVKQWKRDRKASPVAQPPANGGSTSS